MSTIYTHGYLDLDAIISSYIARQEFGGIIKFIGAHDLVSFEQGDIAVDITPKGNINDLKVFDHHYVDTDKTAAELVWEHIGSPNHYEAIVRIARKQDKFEYHKGEVAEMQLLLKGMKVQGRTDAEILGFFHKDILPIMCEVRVSTDEAMNRFKAMGGSIHDDVVAVYESVEPVNGIHGALFESGVGFIVFKSGNNIGILRGGDIIEPSLNQFLKKLLTASRQLLKHQNGFITMQASSPAEDL